jgi:DNA-binding FadR family transcriptional regulator
MAAPGAAAPAPQAADRSIADQVADNLLHRILSGDFAPGDPLPAERELADTMQVSRQSIKKSRRTLSLTEVEEPCVLW